MKARACTTCFIVGATVLVLLAAGALGAVAFLYSGVYQIEADTPHLQAELAVLSTLKRRAVVRHAREVVERPLDDPGLIRRGLVLYRGHCVTCHGAPGEARSSIGTGMNPNPPWLERSAVHWKPKELYWITEHGLKMAGMPAFGLRLDPEELWAITAFVVRMNTLSPSDYRRMVHAVEAPGEEDGAVSWRAPDPGWSELARRGDPARGATHVSTYGCGGCHRIPGVPEALGEVGPPLRDWRKRHYIAGHLVNYPHQLVRWVQDPPAAVPGTAMPELGVSEDEAWDIAAFLYGR